MDVPKPIEILRKFLRNSEKYFHQGRLAYTAKRGIIIFIFGKDECVNWKTWKFIPIVLLLDFIEQYVTDGRYYVVRYTLYHPSINPRYKYFNATDLNCMIDDLKPNTQYEFTVKVVKGRRESPWSMVVLNTTEEAAPATPPRELTVQSNEERPTAVILRWQPPKIPNGQIIGNFNHQFLN